jgi:hypothetical protein
MKIKMVSKNIALGEQITDVREIKKLAGERKSIVWDRGYGNYCVRPASFFLGWQLRVVLYSKLHYSVKV